MCINFKNMCMNLCNLNYIVVEKYMMHNSLNVLFSF